MLYYDEAAEQEHKRTLRHPYLSSAQERARASYYGRLRAQRDYIKKNFREGDLFGDNLVFVRLTDNMYGSRVIYRRGNRANNMAVTTFLKLVGVAPE